MKPNLRIKSCRLLLILIMSIFIKCHCDGIHIFIFSGKIIDIDGIGITNAIVTMPYPIAIAWGNGRNAEPLDTIITQIDGSYKDSCDFIASVGGDEEALRSSLPFNLKVKREGYIDIDTLIDINNMTSEYSSGVTKVIIDDIIMNKYQSQLENN
jgi:hypothetical protein